MRETACLADRLGRKSLTAIFTTPTAPLRDFSFREVASFQSLSKTVLLVEPTCFGLWSESDLNGYAKWKNHDVIFGSIVNIPHKKCFSFPGFPVIQSLLFCLWSEMSGVTIESIFLEPPSKENDSHEPN